MVVFMRVSFLGVNAGCSPAHPGRISTRVEKLGDIYRICEQPSTSENGKVDGLVLHLHPQSGTSPSYMYTEPKAKLVCPSIHDQCCMKDVPAPTNAIRLVHSSISAMLHAQT